MLNQLVKIGFTEYEAKVYLALLRNHPATGYQLSKESGVPRSMVYEALKRLHARGAALETTEARATLYRPLPPEVLLKQHQQEQQQLIEELQAGLQPLYASTADNSVWTIQGETAVTAYAAQLINQAQTELFLVLTDNDLTTLQTVITEAHQRGVILNTLLTGTKPFDLGRAAYHPPLESELQGLTSTLLVVKDDAELLIGSIGLQRKMMATVTRNQELVMIARQFVWMELFTQRIYARLGPDLLARLDPEDRRIFESLDSK